MFGESQLKGFQEASELYSVDLDHACLHKIEMGASYSDLQKAHSLVGQSPLFPQIAVLKAHMQKLQEMIVAEYDIEKTPCEYGYQADLKKVRLYSYLHSLLPSHVHMLQFPCHAMCYSCGRSCLAGTTCDSEMEV